MAETKEMATIYIFGKKYDVPAELTIMNAMEYAGYQLKRGCGCRNGFCGACATIYRIKGQNQLQTCLACSKKVENDRSEEHTSELQSRHYISYAVFCTVDCKVDRAVRLFHPNVLHLFKANEVCHRA